MPKASAIQQSFNAGELSPQLEGRTDLDKYRNGCKTLENFIPKIHGPISKRPGTRYVTEVKASANNCRLIPFEFNVTQAYILEFGDLYMRVYKDGGQVQSGGSPYEMVSPYAHTELSELHFAQSADVMYITHPDYPPKKLARTDHDAWTITDVDFDWPAFDDLNATAVTITASATTGVGITLTASAATFTADSVGEYVKIQEVIQKGAVYWTNSTDVDGIAVNELAYYGGNVYKLTNKNSEANSGNSPPVHTEGTESDGHWDWQYLHSGSGYAEITAFTSTTVVTATVIATLPDEATSGTTKWALNAWSDVRGYPQAIAFYEDRLWFAGSDNKPQTLWASTSGDYENFQYGSNDDDALSYTINSQELNAIQWLAPGKLLIIGTSGGEFIASGSSADEAITPVSVRIIRQTTYGSASLRPFRIGNVVLFMQRARKKIREFVYQFESDNYVAPDMTILANHVLGTGGVDISYQQEPSQILWIPRDDGQLVGMTYERAEEVVAWHRHPIGGDGVVESVATIPHWDGDQDSTWMVVKRTIDSAVVRYIEYIEKELTGDDSFYVDSGLTYDSTPVTTVTGLDHLEGESVAVLADGAIHPNKTVVSGSITLHAAHSTIQVGLPYDAVAQTMRVDAGAADGTSQGKTKRITNVVLRLHETGSGLFYGPDTTELDELFLRSTDDLMDTAVPLFTGDTDLLAWPKGYEQEARVTLKHGSPLPCTVVAVMPQVVTYDR